MPRRKREVVPVEQRTWYTSEEAAARLSVTVNSLHRYVRERKITPIVTPLSGAMHFDKDTIERLRREEQGEIAPDPVAWPGGVKELPPGATVTTLLEVSRV